MHLRTELNETKKNFTCKTTVLERRRIETKRYRQPIILSLSNITSDGGGMVNFSIDIGVEILCIKLIVSAPKTQSNVPIIFTLLNVHFKFTFSNLHCINIDVKLSYKVTNYSCENRVLPKNPCDDEDKPRGKVWHGCSHCC